MRRILLILFIFCAYGLSRHNDKAIHKKLDIAVLRQIVLCNILMVIIFMMSCKFQKKESDKVHIYKVQVFKIIRDNGRNPTSEVYEIAMVNNNIYYFKNDTMLMTYKTFDTAKAIRIKNPIAISFLNKLNHDYCDSLKEKADIYCEAMGENDYVIRLEYGNGVKEEFAIPDVQICQNKSPYNYMDSLTMLFGQCRNVR